MKVNSLLDTLMQVENTGRIGDLPNFFALVYI